MFDGDPSALSPDAALAAAAEYRAVADHAETRLLEVAAHWADLHPVVDPVVDRPDNVILPGMEQTVVCGGDGCPEVAEFAPVEFGAALGVSSTAACALIGDALALRHRLPETWARVRAGAVQPWRARKIAAATHRLSRAAAALVDARVAPIADTVTTHRLERIVQAAVLDADPDQAQAAADTHAAERGVWVGRDDLHGSKTVFIKAAAGDVLRLDASTDRIADLLARLGDTSTKDQRRAKAIGWIADPQAALDLYDAAHAVPHQPAQVGPHPHDDDDAAPNGTSSTDTSPGTSPGTGEGGSSTWGGGYTGRGLATTTGTGGGGHPAGPAPRPGGLGRHTLYVHLTDHTLATGTGLVRTDHDGLGPLLATQLRELLGHDKVIVKPVIDLADHISVDAYEIPARIREHIQLRYSHCIFPYCNRPVRATDLDHVVPFDDTGPPGQTSTENLGPECRLHHRVKTHGNWRCRRLPDGAFEWTSPHGHVYRVDHTGTHSIDTRVDRAS